MATIERPGRLRDWETRWRDWPARLRDWLARWREQVVGAGPGRLIYEICLVTVVTVGATVPAVLAGHYPLAPWLVGISTPILMALRLTNPFTAYVTAALVGLATGGQSTLMLVVLSASAGYRMARWWHVAVAWAVGWVSYLLGPLWTGPLLAEVAITASVAFILLTVPPAGVARLLRRRRGLLTVMHERNLQLHNQQGEIARQAQTRERARIARDLHDSLGHKLTLMSLYAGMLRTADDEQRSAAADLVRQTSSAAMTELRQILGILGQDDGQSSVRPLSGLDELAEQARATGADVQVVRQGKPQPLAALTEHAAYRVIQEGLTNALRHAHGGSIVLLLRYEPDALIAAVTNTAGRRAVGATSGQGLLGLTERVRIANGMLYHGPTPDGGFRLAATLPHLGEEPATADEEAGRQANQHLGAAVVADSADRQQPASSADFVAMVERDQRRSRLALIAATLAVPTLLVLCVAGAWLVTSLAMVDRDTYQAIQVGQPESEVRALLPAVEAAAVGAVGGRPVPDATCVDYYSSITDQLRSGGTPTVYRFCFRDGTLVDKQVFQDQAR